MGWRNFFSGEPEDVQVVFSGDRLEAGMVFRLLEEEGFHPREWDDMAGPSLGLMGTARVVVPREEGEEAKLFLDRVRDEAGGSLEDAIAGEWEIEEETPEGEG